MAEPGTTKPAESMAKPCRELDGSATKITHLSRRQPSRSRSQGAEKSRNGRLRFTRRPILPRRERQSNQ
jgi:hypothetical protein